MKKILFILMLLATTVARAFDFSAQVDEGQTLYFSFNSANTVAVVSPDWSQHTPPTGALSIPATVIHNGTTYTVTEIGLRAFFNCADITSLTIAEGITTIGQMAFYNCTSLDTIHLPSTLTTIATSAFQRTALEHNTDAWANDLLIVDGYLLSALSDIQPSANIPEGVVGIANSAFYYCIGLQQVSFPSTLRFIGDLAFADDENLDSLFLLAPIPPTLSSNAFLGVDGLIAEVPCGKVDTYAAAPHWNTLTLIEAECDTSHVEPVAITPTLADNITTLTTTDGFCLIGAQGKSVELFDLMGHRIATCQQASEKQRFTLPHRGLYLVAIENLGTLKVLYSK